MPFRYGFTFVLWTHELVSRGQTALELPLVATGMIWTEEDYAIQRVLGFVSNALYYLRKAQIKSAERDLRTPKRFARSYLDAQHLWSVVIVHRFCFVSKEVGYLL